MDKGVYQKEKELLLWKLNNVLKGDAFLTRESRIGTPEERKARMEVIAEFTQYIRDYDKNIQLLQEYAEMKERLIDDGR